MSNEEAFDFQEKPETIKELCVEIHKIYKYKWFIDYGINTYQKLGIDCIKEITGLSIPEDVW